MIDKAKIFLQTKGYMVVHETASVVMCRETPETIYLILLTEYNRRIPEASYVQVTESLKQSYEKITGKAVQFLNLCFTQDGMFREELKLVENISGIWLIAGDTGRIYVFENQPQDFDGLFASLERECQKAENRIRFLPYINVLLVIGNLLVFALMRHVLDIQASEQMMYDFGLDWSRVIGFQEWYRLITCMFLHADVSHIYGNMLLLFFVGGNMEECLGHVKYLLLYFTTGIMASLGSMVYHYATLDSAICIGASGAIMGVLGAMTGMMIVCRGREKRFTLRRLLIFFGLSVAQGMLAPQVDNAAHICGFCAGLLFAFLCQRYMKTSDKKIGF